MALGIRTRYGSLEAASSAPHREDGGPGLPMVTLCVTGASWVPRPLCLQPVLLPYPTGQSWVPWDSHTLLTPPSVSGQASGQRGEDQRQRPKKRPQVLERKGLNYLVLLCRGFMRRPQEGFCLFPRNQATGSEPRIKEIDSSREK